MAKRQTYLTKHSDGFGRFRLFGLHRNERRLCGALRRTRGLAALCGLNSLNLSRDLGKIGRRQHRGIDARISGLGRLGSVKRADRGKLHRLQQVMIGCPYPPFANRQLGKAVIDLFSLLAVGVAVYPCLDRVAVLRGSDAKGDKG